MTIKKIMTVGLISYALCGCQPSEPQPDLIKTQREALNKAKAVEGQVMQQANDQKKAIDEAEK